MPTAIKKCIAGVANAFIPQITIRATPTAWEVMAQPGKPNPWTAISVQGPMGQSTTPPLALFFGIHIQEKAHRVTSRYLKERRQRMQNRSDTRKGPYTLWQCTCPRCGTTHTLRLFWSGIGTPRKFCQECNSYRHSISALEYPLHIADNDSVLLA